MSTVPQRFLGWQSTDLAQSSRWIFSADPRLVDASKAELEDWLAPVRQELQQGWGVAWIRGLADLPEKSLRQVFLAIGEGIGSVETTYGTLYDVTDTGASHLTSAIPVSQTRAATSMHTDSSQRHTHPRWVGLACVRPAAEGGHSRLASAVAVHDHLAAHHPVALQRLHRCFHRDLVTPGGLRDRQRRLANRFPVFQQAADGPTLRYMRHWIETGHQRLGKPLPDEDLQAFDILDATLNQPRFCHAFRLEPGDLLFCDNHKLAHDREAYRDDPAAPRLMVRLWLNGPATGPAPAAGGRSQPAVPSSRASSRP